MHLSSFKMIPRETINQLHYKESNRDKSSLSNMLDLVEIGEPANLYQTGFLCNKWQQFSNQIPSNLDLARFHIIQLERSVLKLCN